MSLRIVGIGTAVPEHHVLQDEAAEINASLATTDPQRARTLQALYRRTGVRKRHSVLLETGEGPPFERQRFYAASRGSDDPGPATERRMRRYESDAPSLAALAGRRALEDAGLAAESITHLVTVSCTGFFAPGLDAAVIERLGLSRTVERTHVGFMGCHGALNGLRVARSFIEAEPDSVVIVCSVELCSLHFSYGWDPEMLVPNALFSDGAAAVVGRSANGGDGGAWRVAASGTLLFPDSSEDMTWRIGDHGFRMTLSARVPELISSGVAESL